MNSDHLHCLRCGAQTAPPLARRRCIGASRRGAWPRRLWRHARRLGGCGGCASGPAPRSRSAVGQGSTGCAAAHAAAIGASPRVPRDGDALACSAARVAAPAAPRYRRRVGRRLSGRRRRRRRWLPRLRLGSDVEAIVGRAGWRGGGDPRALRAPRCARCARWTSMRALDANHRGKTRSNDSARTVLGSRRPLFGLATGN